MLLTVYEDEHSEVAPLARTGRDDDNVRPLCTVKADLHAIPESQISQRRGKDGFMYYYLEGEIEAIRECIWSISPPTVSPSETNLLIDGGTSAAYTLIYGGKYPSAMYIVSPV